MGRIVAQSHGSEITIHNFGGDSQYVLQSILGYDDERITELMSCLANIWSDEKALNWRNTAFLARKAESDPCALLQ